MKLTILATVTLFGGAFFGAAASAQTEPPRFTDQIRMVLATPTDAKHQPIYDALQERGLLDMVRSILRPFRLPRLLTIEIKGCDGDEEAQYGDGVATLCYEYIELIQRHSPKVGTPGGVARVDAVFGGIIDTLLHEAGHGVFELLEIPVLGREEDAADFFSLYIMLHFAPENALRLLEGVAFMFASEARLALQKPFGIRAYAGEHSLAPQRSFNLLCMAYGSDSKTFSKLAIDGGLPASRHEGCIEEYGSQSQAFEKLIGPYIDSAMYERMRNEIRFGWRPLLTNGLDPQPLAEWMMRAQPDDDQTRTRRP